jgi:hypothetical protein
MRVQPPLPAIWRESLKASASGIHAPGKSSNSAHLGDEERGPDRQARKERPKLQVELVCQEGTKAHDPFWDGPRLKPAFVTQLLGQMMTGGQAQAPAHAYGESQASAALLLDARF